MQTFIKKFFKNIFKNRTLQCELIKFFILLNNKRKFASKFSIEFFKKVKKKSSELVLINQIMNKTLSKVLK